VLKGDLIFDDEEGVSQGHPQALTLVPLGYSIKLPEFTTKSKLAWSPSSSCATGEHAADRLVTLSYLSYRQKPAT
jgi:hypothetical protein